MPPFRGPHALRRQCACLWSRARERHRCMTRTLVLIKLISITLSLKCQSCVFRGQRLQHSGPSNLEWLKNRPLLEAREAVIWKWLRKRALLSTTRLKQQVGFKTADKDKKIHLLINPDFHQRDQWLHLASKADVWATRTDPASRAKQYRGKQSVGSECSPAAYPHRRLGNLSSESAALIRAVTSTAPEVAGDSPHKLLPLIRPHLKRLRSQITPLIQSQVGAVRAPRLSPGRFLQVCAATDER